MMRSKDGQTVTLTRSVVIAIVLVSILIITVAGGMVYAVLSNQNLFSSYGRIVTIGCKVYGNAALTQEIIDIDWGDQTPGAQVTRNLWVKNNGTIPTTLSLSLGDWVPLIAQQYMTLSWNYNGQALQPALSVPVVLTFSVNPLITGVGNFYFNIYVISTQA